MHPLFAPQAIEVPPTITYDPELKSHVCTDCLQPIPKDLALTLHPNVCPATDEQVKWEA